MMTDPRMSPGDIEAPHRSSHCRSYWVRAHLPDQLDPDPAETAEVPPPRPPKGQRFLEPRRFSPAQRQRLLQALSDHHIGDEESRALFLAAIEYDLASCKIPEPAPEVRIPPVSELAPAPLPLPPDPVLEELATQAGNLARSVAALDDHRRQGLRQRLEETDCFARGYGEAYFAILERELEHLASACLALTPTPSLLPTPSPAPGPPPAAPALAPAWRDFLSRVANAFGECFEVEPRGEAGSPFPLTLEALSEATGLLLPLDQDSLAEVLGPPPVK